jgi:hypothetical protein
MHGQNDAEVRLGLAMGTIISAHRHDSPGVSLDIMAACASA